MNRELAGIDPSRRLDIQIHTALFSGTVYEVADGDTAHYLLDQDGTELPTYSSDWRGMQLVVEAMLARGFAIDIEIDSISQACLITHSGTGQEGSASDFCLPGTKLPELVTRAALAALGVPMTEDV